ncbi:PREDICTED: complement factor D-like [Wasmannia auropunctata]|uniref:complement factor D-like n=1 Tax=Wasmannia auropunctata TaxID=64793 RepID=UPI0005EF3E31|nr:PREDICTED: complement factor D-like [Wasmannia auropunctata]
MLSLAWILIFVAVSGANAEITQNDVNVDITKYPSVVSIRRNGKHVCSGAILDEYHVITSDRCVPPFKHVWNVMNNIVVVSGTSSLKPGGIRTFVKEMFSQNHHVNPLENNVTSGLGVLKLIRPLQFDKNTQPIVLSETEVPLGAKVQMVGWMIADHEGRKTANLKELTLTTVNLQECQSFHEKELSKSEFCTQVESESNYCKVRKYYKNVTLKGNGIF